MTDVYRELPDHVVPTQKSISDRKAAWAGLSGLALGPFVFLVSLLFAVPIILWHAVESLIRYTMFRAVQIGHVRLGIESDRRYVGPVDQRLQRLTQFAARVWGRSTETTMNIIMSTIYMGAVIQVLFATGCLLWVTT